MDGWQQLAGVGWAAGLSQAHTHPGRRGPVLGVLCVQQGHHLRHRPPPLGLVVAAGSGAGESGATAVGERRAAVARGRRAAGAQGDGASCPAPPGGRRPPLRHRGPRARESKRRGERPNETAKAGRLTAEAGRPAADRHSRRAGQRKNERRRGECDVHESAARPPPASPEPTTDDCNRRCLPRACSFPRHPPKSNSRPPRQAGRASYRAEAEHRQDAEQSWV